MDGREVARRKSIFDKHDVLKLQSMVDQDGPSSKLEAKSGGVKDAHSMAGRKPEEGAAKGFKTS